MKVLSIIVVVILALCLADNLSDNPQANPVNNRFTNGEVLTPDYAIRDTLIVVDAKGLELALIESSKDVDFIGDAEVDSLFNQYCIKK